MSSMSFVTLFRQSATAWPGGPTVHVLDKHHGYMLTSPTPCHVVLAAILAETVIVERDALVRRERAELLNRNYCRQCLDTVGLTADK